MEERAIITCSWEQWTTIQNRLNDSSPVKTRGQLLGADPIEREENFIARRTDIFEWDRK